MNRPGYRLRAVAARWCSERTMERLVDPAIADLQTEYAEAARAGRVWHSRWIWLAGHAACAKAIVWHGVEHAARSLRGVTAEERRALARTVMFGVVAMVVAILLFSLLPFVSVIAGNLSERVRLTAYAVPQLLPLCILVGVTFGILFGIGGSRASRRSRTLILLLAFISSLVSFALVGWISPASKQSFRVAVARTLGVDRPVARGVSELTLGELSRLLEPGTHEPMALTPPHDMRILEKTYHSRWALSCTPFVLSLFALTLTGGRRRGPWRLGLIGSATVVGYIALDMATQVLLFDRNVPAFPTVWIPNAIFLILAAIMKARRAAGEA